MKSLKRLLLLALAVALAAAFASCAAKPATYTVTYELNGGVNHPDNPATYTSESGAITLKDPSRNGYTFNGWSPDGGVIPAGSTGDKVFTANWTGNAANPLTYTITYVLDGGVNHPDNPATYTSESGAISLKDPSRDGYTFDGWTPDGGVIPTGSTGAKTFTANWTENSSQSGTNTITYDFQDGTGARETRTVTAGAPYTLIDGPVYAPYTFGGWYPEIGGGGTEKKSGTSYNAGNITLYAYWKGTDRVYYENVPDVVGEAQVKGLSQPATLSPGTLVIQPYYNGKPVTRIGNSAFIASSEIQKITDVLFPDSMRIIGSRAFE
ncbi:MAG: InlB B-repeat-containing protein, partial [Clostridiales bacterium]|nr:InlB B-repeat-containing protein [Clostridiales bacterium]